MKEKQSENARNYIMPFGKHKGTRLGGISETYLNWLAHIDLSPYPELKGMVMIVVTSDGFRGDLRRRIFDNKVNADYGCWDDLGYDNGY